ncbi:MAG: hypothetical protein IIZ25_05565 [Thermoguttaceae bacterium]|nr:hypothetical protein [Thermoguttaceae bacterium]
MKRTTILLASLVMGTLSFAFEAALRAQEAGEAVHIGSNRELLADPYLIGSLDGTAQKLWPPRDEGPVLFLDRPWEGELSIYMTVLHVGSKYQLYYRGKGTSQVDRSCYAESEDGVHWTRPDLGFVSWEGYTGTNILFEDDPNICHNFAPFYDANPNCPPEQRYKALAGRADTGLFAFVSPDGIHWKKLQEGTVAKHQHYACDSQNVSFWSESEKKYLCYLRAWDGDWTGFRTVIRLESDDFIHWGPEGGLRMTYGDTEREHLYINQTAPYFRAPQLYIATAARLMEGKRVITPEEAKACSVMPGEDDSCSDAVMMTTRGGSVYDRTFMESLVRPGLDPGDWVARTNYPVCGIVQTGPDEMSLYVERFYNQPRVRIHRYSWKLDRIASVSAPYAGGEFRTKPLIFTGEDLFINANTSAAGTIQVEILDKTGQPIPGYELDKSPVLTGNWIEKKIRWAEDKSAAPLAGQEVILRFVMKDADIYALRFGAEE